MQRLTKLWRDNRGIEGLPIRLVIALVVGVASLAIMTSILGGLPTFETTELTYELDDGEEATVTDAQSRSSAKELNFNVVDENGEPVNGVQVVIEGGSVSTVGGTYVESTGEDSNEVDITFADDDASSASPDVETNLRADQNKGTLKVSLQPPSDGNYEDEQDNPEILVTA
ncbi:MULTISPECIES: hypothetical protein [Haloarcula]|uniref:hypothetical protein n=1 Tax=Haloarcula TaxID=2237 RepID=UPI0023E77AE5|nr:hypothetical protein [Halomicroarcula sp. SHR3]